MARYIRHLRPREMRASLSPLCSAFTILARARARSPLLLRAKTKESSAVDERRRRHGCYQRSCPPPLIIKHRENRSSILLD